MLFSSSFVLAAMAAGIAQAQTPTGFTPSTNTKLDVFFNSTTISRPGQLLTKAATASQPQIAIAGTSNITSSDTYLFMMVDLDVPPASGSTERRTLLHAMVTNFKASSQTLAGGAKLLTSQEKGPAVYFGPSPPASDSTPHRYVELLFKQPENLQVAATAFADTQDRIGFEVDDFARENGLGQPLAGNFFTVSGQAGGAGASATGGTFGTATGSGGIVRNTIQPFEGAAMKVDAKLGIAGMLGGLVLAVV